MKENFFSDGVVEERQANERATAGVVIRVTRRKRRITTAYGVRKAI